jgi:WS/DGAT/MGAT family acyltransferase
MTTAVLSPLDSAFLRLESAGSPLHIASLAVFDGPAPDLEELRTLYAGKLDQLPRYRQRLCESPLWLGSRMWVDDDGFRLDRHLQAVALPPLAGVEDVRSLCARLLERPLDRAHPLWETWLVDGLPDGQWGLLSKVHHCMVDGIAGTDLLAHVLDLSAEAPPPPAPAAWEPAPLPGWHRRVLAGLPRPRPQEVLTALAHPRQLAREAATDAAGLRQWLSALLPVQASPLLGPVGKERDWLWADVPLADVKQVAHGLDGTVNDVVVALVCGALRELLLADGT